MPFPDGCFTAALSSQFFHHLATEPKRATLDEKARVLRRGGRLHIADWGAPQNLAMRIAFQSIRLLDGYATTAEFGTMALYRARKPA
jgi:ubiquinone/menaquinone biosynthesis C-methylase UbiE